MSGDANEPSHNWGVDENDEVASVRPVSQPMPAPPPPPPVEEVQEEELPEPMPASEAASEADDAYSEHDFEQDDEPFDRPDAHKLGIIGGKGVGKSYLFQAMVYRTFSGQHSGALTYFLEKDSIRLFTAAANPSEIIKTGVAKTLNRVKFIEKYQRWERLATTTLLIQQWYRLRLRLRSGWLGKTESALDVEFFDGSGEGFFEMQATKAEEKRLWRKAYRDARVMVFCLPIWAAFPNADLTDAEWEDREKLLSGFDQVLQNYNDMRQRHNETAPVSGILALTMADDDRSALRTLRDRWITPYLQSPQTYLKQLRKGWGVARYLSNARQISEALQEEFASSRDPRVASIPQSLDFGRGLPWIIPLSAVDGARLDQLAQLYKKNPDDSALRREVRSGAPTPVHVELPLLVALCERDNALM